MKRREFAIGLALLAACYVSQITVATAKRKAEATKFKVRVENISNPEGMTASNGQKFPFALSPGLFVLSDKSAPLFTEGKPARKNGLEMQAEDGDPSGLVASLVAMHHSSNLHGVFNTPVGAMGAGPIRPGDSYEFNVTAMPGTNLFMTQMFGFTRPGQKASPCSIRKARPSAVISQISSICGTRAPRKMKKLVLVRTRGHDKKARTQVRMKRAWYTASTMNGGPERTKNSFASRLRSKPECEATDESSLCNRCVLCASVVVFSNGLLKHRDTNTEDAQRKEKNHEIENQC